MANQGGIYSVLDDERINGEVRFMEGVGTGFDGSWASSLGELVQSDSEIENYTDLESVAQAALWEGEAVLRELANFNGALRNLEYITGLRISKADLRRDKVGRIGSRLADLGRRMGTQWETLVTNKISAGETDGSKTIGDVNDLASQAYDGQAFFDTDHSFAGAKYDTAQSNDLSGGNFNVATAEAPTVEEAAKFIPDIIGNFWAIKDSAGEPANGECTDFVMMVGTNALYAPIRHAISAEALASGASNQVRGLVEDAGVNIRLIFNTRLSAKTDKVYTFCTNGMPFILQEETPAQVVEQDRGNLVKYIEVAAWATRAVGYGDWTKAQVATLS